MERLQTRVGVETRYLALEIEGHYDLKSWGRANDHWIEIAQEIGHKALCGALARADFAPSDLGGSSLSPSRAYRVPHHSEGSGQVMRARQYHPRGRRGSFLIIHAGGAHAGVVRDLGPIVGTRGFRLSGADIGNNPGRLADQALPRSGEENKPMNESRPMVGFIRGHKVLP